MSTALLSVLIAIVGMALAFVAGWTLCRAAFVLTMRRMAEQRLTAAEYETYTRLLAAIYGE